MRATSEIKRGGTGQRKSLAVGFNERLLLSFIQNNFLNAASSQANSARFSRVPGSRRGLQPASGSRSTSRVNAPRGTSTRLRA